LNSQFEKSVAIIIGIDKYGQGIPELSSAVNDALQLASILESQHQYQLKSLIDADASLERIEYLLDEYLPQNIGENDRVLFYFAGHGVAIDADDGPKGYLLLQDSKRSEVATFLEMRVLHDKLMTLPCRHMLIVLDSCFSGAFRWSSNRDIFFTPDIVHQEAYERFIKDPAWQLLTSAAHDQTAADQLLSGSLGSRGNSKTHSPFALALFDALDGKADIVPEGGDGIITATELYVYLESRLQTETIEQGHRQTPGLWPLKRHDKGEYIFEVPGKEINLPPAPELNLENNPYQGLSAYGYDQAALFFGRTKAIKELVNITQANRLTTVIGASGSGKSSLVKAGLVPALEASGWQLVAIIRPGQHPLASFKNCLVNVKKDSKIKMLIVIDQFEELMTMTRDLSEREAFLSLLVEQLNSNNTKLHIVLTIRADFEAHFQIDSLKVHWHAGRYIVPPLARDELKEIIEQPANERVLYFEPSSLIQRLVDDVVAMPGALPLLSFTLSEMYLLYLAADRGDRALTEEDYDKLGGVAGALKTRADAEYQILNIAEKNTLERLMLRMMQFEHGLPARQRVLDTELVHWDHAENQRIKAIVTQLCNARLLVKGVSEGGDSYVEPAHDALITSWTKLLQWTTARQSSEPNLSFLQSLAHNAQAWSEANLDVKPGLLWRDKARSDRLWALRKKDRLLLNQQEDEFCRLSVKRQRIIRSVTIASVFAIFVSAIAAVGFGIVANTQLDEVVKQRDEAERQTIIANSNALAASVANALDGQNNPTIAINLAKSALDVNSDNEYARWLIRRAVYGKGIININGRPYSTPLYRTITDNPGEAIWSSTGKYVAVYEYESAKTKIYHNNGELSGVIEDSSFGLGQFSDDDKYYINGDKQAYSVIGEKTRPGFSPEPTISRSYGKILITDVYAVFYHATSQNGRMLAGHDAMNGSQDIDLFVANDIFPKFQIIKDNKLINTLSGVWHHPSLSPDGTLLATANYDGEVVLWQITGTGEEATRLANIWQTGQADDAWILEFSPDGTQLMVAMRGGPLRIWDITWNSLSAKEQMIKELASRSFEESQTRMQATLDDSNAGNDTPYFTINATDTVNQTSWTRDVVTSSANIKLMNDMLVLNSDNGIELYDSKGISQLNLKNIGVLDDSTHIPEHLIVRSSTKGMTLAIPINPSSILARAEKRGLLGLTEAEKQSWGIEQAALASLDNNKIEKTEVSLVSQIGQSLTELFWEDLSQDKPVSNKVDDSDNVSGPEIEQVIHDIPLLWEKIALSHEESMGGFYDQEFPGNVRWYLTNVKEAGIPALLNSLGAPKPFLSGPHTMQYWKVYQAEKGSFGHYNPAFLNWLDVNILPNSEDSALRIATQSIYDKSIRNMLRIYAIGLKTLEANPDLKQRVLDEYLTIEGGHNYYILEVMDEAAASIGMREEAEKRDFAFAMGFWIRRELDGTSTKFEELMNRALASYDKEFLAALEKERL
jgi:WD40 repeat protein